MSSLFGGFKKPAKAVKRYRRKQKIKRVVKSGYEKTTGFIIGGVGTKKEQAKRRKANARTTKKIMRKVKRKLIW